jgi:hypothetical protein
LWQFGIFLPFWYFGPRKIWQHCLPYVGILVGRVKIRKSHTYIHTYIMKEIKMETNTYK